MNISRICSSVFLILGLYTQGYADEQFPFLAQVSKESVNIRAGANTNFEVIDKLKLGSQIVVLSKSYDWYKIQLPISSKAFIRADYLLIRSHSVAELLGDKVNIRASANSDSSSLGRLKKGELVKLVKQTNEWWQIEPPLETFGWIREDFISFKSRVVDSSFMREPLVFPAQETHKNTFTTTDVKGQLKSLASSEANIRYELMINGKLAYYIQSIPNIDRFKNATVLIKGVVIADPDHRYEYPMLRAINISLLL